MKKKLFLFVVMVAALVCLLALTSYAATITIYPGTDTTAQPTVYQTSQIALTGNTEANETVTVYYTDDGRAWKAGETVTFTEDTRLYTIECTKISNYTEYGSAAGEGNYILTGDIDLTKGGGKISGDNCTTRLFMNGKTVNLGNGDRPMFGGNSHSFYLLGQGTVTSAWGGGIYRGHCKNSTVDVVWFFGKDVTVHSNKDSSAFITIWNHIGSKSLNIYVYGKVLKPTSGNAGTWSFLSTDTNARDYNIYIYESATIELVSRFINYNSTGSTEGYGNIYIEGGNITLSSADYFYRNQSSATFDGTLEITGGTFNIANAATLAEFKAAAIAAGKSVQELSATSFKIGCLECDFQLVLGEGFENLGKDFTIDSYCPNCGARTSKAVAAVFEPLGYSISERSGYGIFYGYKINQESLAEYKAYLEANGKSATFGVFIANATRFGENDFVSSDGTLGTASGIKIEMPLDYSVVNCYINGFTKDEVDLNLVMAIYTIEDGVVTYAQKEGTYAGEVTKGGVTLNVVTFRKIAELVGRTDIDIILPPESNEDQD